MKCQEESGCDREAVGTDVVGEHLCQEHLAFSAFVQRVLNKELKDSGKEDLIPDYAKIEDKN
jgi:hypothetical protein